MMLMHPTVHWRLLIDNKLSLVYDAYILQYDKRQNKQTNNNKEQNKWTCRIMSVVGRVGGRAREALVEMGKGIR